jgi:sialic acid synthase SpsE
VVASRRAWQALGTVSYGPTEAERPSLQFRRSLYVVQDLKAGDALTGDNVRAIRPGLGLPPKHLDDVLGRRAAVDIRRGTPLAWELVG